MGAEWACLGCTLINAPSAARCGACSSSRPTSDDALQAALAASAALHSSTTASTVCEGRFSTPRSAVRALPCLPAPPPAADSLLLQVGVLNQFHPRWLPLIRRYNAPAAICGYLSLAHAVLLAGIPAPLPATTDALLPHLLRADAVEPLVEAAMAAIHAQRSAWVAAHPRDFEGAASASAYMRAWVANYEISDYLRSLPPHLAQHVVFLRYNQRPELPSAAHEELARLAEEAPFGGAAGRGSKSSPDSFGPADSMFIVEVFGSAEAAAGTQRRLLLRPSDPAVARGARSGAWRAAVLDLDGHFAVAVALQGQLHLLNTTATNCLSGASGGALQAAAMAHDVLLARGVVGRDEAEAAAERAQ